MNVLVACEESQIVCKEFLKKGHNAFSCDIIAPSGDRPDRHILGDVMEVLNAPTGFSTMNGTFHFITKWDLIIAHPPCTYLCRSGCKHYNVELYGDKAIERQKKREDAIKFFLKIANANCEKICIENPMGIMTTVYKKPTQYIQPYEFGHPCKKKTGLWLKNLTPLKPTNIVTPQTHTTKSGKVWDIWFWKSSLISNKTERAKFRSKTFKGIAEAMANQWG
jgi:hypothetical protein